MDWNSLSFLRDQRDRVYTSEIELLGTIQRTFIGQEKVLLSSWVSFFGQSSFVYFVFFPLILGWERKSGLRFLGSLCLSEWINFILKIFMMGDRPYWWLREQPSSLKLPALKQTPMTCETDPGIPSSFLQLNTVVWYTLVSILNEKLVDTSGFGDTTKMLLRRNLWKLYGVYLIFLFITVSVSASHFPHQCIFGVVCGIFAINKAFANPSWMSWKKSKLLLVSCFLAVSAFYARESAAKITGYPFDWSQGLARKWCGSKEWLRIDPTPMSTVIRLGGSSLALALSNLSGPPQDGGTFNRIIRTLLSVALGYAAHSTIGLMDKKNLPVFYLMEYLILLLFTYCTISILPRVFKYLTRNKKKSRGNKGD